MLESIRDAYRFLTDVQGIVQWGGILLVCTIVFVETGLFVGFFLPGDSLLVTAGIFAAAGHLDLKVLLGIATVCAIAGDQLNYWIGRRAGQALYRRENTFFFRRQHLERAHEFYERYGGKTIILARFVPIVRTFSGAVAGAANMRYRRFAAYDVLGGFLWVWSMVLTGYSLSAAIPGIEQHIHVVIVVVVAVSLLPAVIELLRGRRNARPAAAAATGGTNRAPGRPRPGVTPAPPPGTES